MGDLLRSSCTGYAFANICSEKYIISEQIIHLLHSEYLDKDEQSFVTVYTSQGSTWLKCFMNQNLPLKCFNFNRCYENNFLHWYLNIRKIVEQKDFGINIYRIVSRQIPLVTMTQNIELYYRNVFELIFSP